jgi:hypothetical protein
MSFSFTCISHLYSNNEKQRVLSTSSWYNWLGFGSSPSPRLKNYADAKVIGDKSKKDEEVL